MVSSIPCVYVSQLLYLVITDRHLGCFHMFPTFHILAIINNATMNIGVIYSLELLFQVCLDILPEVQSMGHKSVQFFVSIYFQIFIEFIWVILVNRIMFQEYNSITHHLYFVLCAHHPNKASFYHHLSLLLSSTSPTSFPSNNHHMCLWIIFCLIPSPFSSSPTTLLPSDSCQSVLCIYESVSMLFVSLFCLLDSMYKWNHTVFVFLWLAYFTEHNIVQVNPCCHKR